MEQTAPFTLSQLECFLATLQQGSFTGAADALGVSQPAVAEQIARLERIVVQSPQRSTALDHLLLQLMI